MGIIGKGYAVNIGQLKPLSIASAQAISLQVSLPSDGGKNKYTDNINVRKRILMPNNIALFAALKSTAKKDDRESPKQMITKRIDREPNKAHVEIEMIHRKG
ncbi:MAG: hypothetical protein QFX33_04115 [Candidatus Nezhaarchaeota archaeon]|nr:hypothetical protein [Candidatus Nezhaarchaeota archaeon]